MNLSQWLTENFQHSAKCRDILETGGGGEIARWKVERKKIKIISSKMFKSALVGVVGVCVYLYCRDVNGILQNFTTVPGDGTY